MGSSWRILGCAVGFAFGVVWMTVGLGPAIVCLLVAGLGYGAVFMAERAQANRPPNRIAEPKATSVAADELGADDEGYDALPDDASTPLAAEAEYGWPWPTGNQEEAAEQDHAPLTGKRAPSPS